MQLILSFIGGLLSKLIAPLSIFWAGGKHKELKNAQEVIDDVKKINAIDGDDRYDNELLEKYRDK